MAINNPYIPGDPYSYDLKWIVRRIREHSAILTDIDQKIAEAISQYLDQHDPFYYGTADELIHTSIENGSIAYIEGFNAAGDGGANLYYITGNFYDVQNEDFYLTMATGNQWALPIIMTYYVTPEMFGAFGDGTTDDTAAMTVFCKKVDYDQIGAKTYKVTTPITIEQKKKGRVNIAYLIGNIIFDECDNCDISVVSEGPEYNGGHVYTGNENFNFGDLPDVGIQFIQCYSNVITVGSYQHEIGVQLKGKDRGCVYNTFTLKSLANNVISLDLYGALTSWVNENLFMGGTFANSSNNPHRTENVGIRIWRGPNNTYSMNSNSFIKPSFEMWGLPILGEHANFNTFMYCRAENQTSKYARFDDTSQGNKITFGYSSQVMDVQPLIETKGVNNNLAYSRDLELIREGFAEFYSWHFEADKISYPSNGAGRYFKHVPGLNAYYISSSVLAPQTQYFNKLVGACIQDTDGVIIDDQFSYGLALEARDYMQIGMDATLFSGTIRFSVNCYDASWNQVALTSADFSGQGWAFQNNQIYSNSNTDGFFQSVTLLNTSIKHVVVAVRTYNGAVLSSLRFYTGDILTAYNYRPPVIDQLLTPLPDYSKAFVKYGKAGQMIPQNAVTTGTDSAGTYYITGHICTSDGNNWQAVKSYV